MASISLCMVVKNEEHNIERCLNSVRNIADEINIIDTGSADNTKQIAKIFAPKAKIFDFKWIDDFSAARNEGLKHATKDWILVIDADEIIDEDGTRQINELMKRDDAKIEGYILPQKNYTNDMSVAGFLPIEPDELSKGCTGFYVSLICRLFRNKKGYKFSGAVHELVEPSIAESDGRMIPCGVIIHHYGNVDNEKAKSKKEFYLKLAKMKAEGSPDATTSYELGLLLKENNAIKEAEAAFKKALSFNPKHAPAIYELGIIKEANKELDEAIGYYLNSLRIKEDAESFFSLGSCYLKKGMLKEAYRNLIKSLLLNPNKHQTYNNLGAIHEKNNNFEEAVKVLEIGIKLNPKNVVGYYNLGVVYDRQRNNEKAIECFEKALALGYKKDILEKKIREMKEQIENSVKYRYSFGAEK